MSATVPAPREVPLPADEAAVRGLVAATGFFSAEEVEIAAELVRETLRAPDCGYRFLFLEEAGRLQAYTCYGRIPGTRSGYDLYWIATAPALQGRGLGRRLLVGTEQRIRAAGGTHVWVETSSRPLYAPTRAFYERCGYARAAELADFYAPGDAKVIYVRALGAGAGGEG